MRFLIACSLVGIVATFRPTVADTIRFDRDVRPILSDKCFYCHGPDQENREADLRLDIEEFAREMIGDGEESELVARITTSDRDEIMPPADSHKKLSASEIDLLKRWVSNGGPWTEHWSFVPPAKTAVARPQSNPIDRFIRRDWIRKGFSRRHKRRVKN